MKRGTIFLCIAAMILMASAVSAEEISATHTGDNVVEIGGSVVLTLHVTNDDFKTKTLQITPEPFASLPSSFIDMFSIDPKIIELGSQKTEDVKVTIRMKQTVMPNDNYGTYVRIEDINKPTSKIEHNIVLKIIPPEEVVSVSADIPERIAPGSEMTAKVGFRNNMNTQLSNVEVYVGSELFEEKKTMILFPLQKRSEEFKFKIPSMAKPQDYTFTVRVYHDGVLNGRFSKTFTMLTNSDVKQEAESKEGFLIQTITITKTNFGNSVATEYYDYPASWFTKMFLSSSISPTSIDSAGLHWIFDINPGEKVVLQIKRSYVPLVIILAVIVLFGLVSYYILTRGLIIRKQVFKLRKASADTAEFTVMLHIKNRTRGVVKDLIIYEILPKFMNASTHFGTLKPDTMQKGEQGMKMVWKIPELSRGEERIISYQVDSKISVIGRIALPAAMMRFKSVSGRIVNVRSNAVAVSIGSEKQ